jgi:putative two-component system response regulator
MSNEKILIIEDEQFNRNAITRLFEDHDYDFIEAGNGLIGLDKLQKHTPDLILLDIKMPIMDGFGFLEQFSKSKFYQIIPICVMTAFNDPETRKKAIGKGANDFIGKPIDDTELETRVTSLLRVRRYQKELLEFNETLEYLVDKRTLQLKKSYEKLEVINKENSRSYKKMLSRIASLSAKNDSAYRNHLSRVGLYSAYLCWTNNIPQETGELISIAAQTYNIGMLALPDKLRNTSLDQMNKEEYAIYFKHCEIGARLFSDSDSELLKMAEIICQHHHEHVDGSGKPKGIKGDDIPIEARIVTAAICVDEIVNEYLDEDESNINDVIWRIREEGDIKIESTIVNPLLESPEDILNIHNLTR